MSKLTDKVAAMAARNVGRASMQNTVIDPEHTPVCKHCVHGQWTYSHDGGHIRCWANEESPDVCTNYTREPGGDDDYEG